MTNNSTNLVFGILQFIPEFSILSLQELNRFIVYLYGIFQLINLHKSKENFMKQLHHHMLQ